jgi:hypothetical protein
VQTPQHVEKQPLVERGHPRAVQSWWHAQKVPAKPTRMSHGSLDGLQVTINVRVTNKIAIATNKVELNKKWNIKTERVKSKKVVTGT